MTVTAATIITDAMRLFGILDQTEDPTPTDVANNVRIMGQLLRSEMMDGACQFLMRTVTATLPAGTSGSIYTFTIGTAASNLVQQDAVAVKSIWIKDIGNTINRETRMAPKPDVVRTTYPGIVTKWHQERQSDGSILVTAWQPPRASVPILLDLGLRLPDFSAADGSGSVELPPEGLHDATLLLGLTISGSYGRPIDKVDPVIAQRAMQVDKRWRDWGRGQQWLRFVRS